MSGTHKFTQQEDNARRRDQIPSLHTSKLFITTSYVGVGAIVHLDAESPVNLFIDPQSFIALLSATLKTGLSKTQTLTILLSMADFDVNGF